MNPEINGLTMNGNYFALPELMEICKVSIKNNTDPEWKLEVYGFILDFLSELEFINQQTSGSTGTPKTIQLSKQAMLKSAKMTTDFFQLKESQVAVLCLPVKYIAGKMMVVRAFFAGLNLILIEPASTPDFSKIDKTDFCAMVPMQSANLLEQNKWPEIKTLILGGAETNPELAAKLRSTKTEVYETYGMAETCSHVALKKISGKHPENFFTALPEIEIRKDERDCLAIKIPFLQEEVITNDCVELVSEKQFRWLGRVDNIINSGGIKIQPEILERNIESILQLKCALVGVPDDLLGQKMVLVVEMESEMNTEKLVQKLSVKIDKKSLPKAVFFLPRLPRNSSFKIDRIKLKEMIYGLSNYDSLVSADFRKK